MAAPSPASFTVRFRVFEFDPQSGELRKNGLKIKLHGQPIQVLQLLLERPGQVVTREEFREKIWSADTHVDFEHGLNAAIQRLREALGDSAENPRFVETLPRRGYRFIAPVETPPELRATGPHRFRLRYAWMAGLAVVALVAVLLGLNVGGRRDRLLGRTTPSQIRSVAVLPLANLSGDPEQDYFAEGMTDALITELGQITALRVISRTSAMHYKGVDKPLPEIARELKVDAVVEGSVLRSGNRVRITAQLIEAETDRHLWSETYEGDLQDVLSLQSKAARAIASGIRVKLTAEEQTRLASPRPVNPAAYEAYLKGRYLLSKRTHEGFEKAIEYFGHAIIKNSNYALAYAGLADSYNLQALLKVQPPTETFRKAKLAALKALELDETLAEAHSSLAVVTLQQDWDWSGAEREFRRAIELNPSYALARHWYAQYLSAMGRHEEALAESQQAGQLDPLSLAIITFRGHALFFARQYDQAIEALQATVEMEPTFWMSHWLLGRVYVQERICIEGITELEQAAKLSTGHTYALGDLGYAYAACGRRDEALRVLKGLKEPDRSGYLNPVSPALIHLGLGENDRAFALFEQAYAQRDHYMIFLNVEPKFDNFRSDPRFQDLLRRMNFPQ